jgi:sirohydrochlorin cobaltochelatase
LTLAKTDKTVKRGTEMRSLVFLLFGLIGFVTLITGAHGAQGESRLIRKEAILLVTFGSSAPETQRVFDHIEAQVKQVVPGVPTRWAYTSRIIRNKLALEGRALDSPEMALARLMDEGFTHVAVLSLLTIPGIEFHELHNNARLFELMAGGLRRVVVAAPLLASHLDMKRAAQAMLKNIPTERRPEDAVVLMGHGSEKHAADAIYAGLNAMLQELDARVFLASVQGYPALDDVLPKLRQQGAKKVFLIPFMSVAGEHARKDMAGDGPDSWKSILTGNGYACAPVLKGTAEYPETMEIWLDHLRSAMTQLHEEH